LSRIFNSLLFSLAQYKYFAISKLVHGQDNCGCCHSVSRALIHSSPNSLNKSLLLSSWDISIISISFILSGKYFFTKPMTYSLVSAKSIQSFTSSGPLATALRAIHTLMVTFCHLGIFLKRYHNENNTKSSLYNLPSLIHVLLNTFPIYHVRFSGLI